MPDINIMKGGKEAMIGWIIVLVLIVVAFGVGAIFCAPWSPVRKKREAANKK